MKSNAVIPYALIALIGILLVIVLSTAGVFQRDSIEQEQQEGDTEEQNDDSKSAEEGETTKDPEAIVENNNCIQCHGDDLSGKNGPSLNDVGGRLSKKEIKNTIIQGTDGGMPGGLVSDEKAKTLADWLSKKK